MITVHVGLYRISTQPCYEITYEEKLPVGCLMGWSITMPIGWYTLLIIVVMLLPWNLFVLITLLVYRSDQ